MKYTKIKINDIIVDDPILNKKDRSFKSLIGLSINKELSDVEDFTFEMAPMKVKKINNNKIELEFMVNHPNFYKFIYDVDRYIFDIIMENGEEWFGKPPKYETLDRLFQRSIKQQETLTSYPTMGFDISDICIIKDINGDNIKITEIEENNEVLCTVTIKQIIFRENRFYLDFRLEEINIVNYVCQQTECLFSESE